MNSLNCSNCSSRYEKDNQPYPSAPVRTPVQSIKVSHDLYGLPTADLSGALIRIITKYIYCGYNAVRKLINIDYAWKNKNTKNPKNYLTNFTIF